MADKLVLAECLNIAECEQRPPPSLRFNYEDGASKRKYTVVSVEAKWDCLRMARDVRTSCSTVLALTQILGTSEFGCAEKMGAPWMRKEQEIYHDQCGLALSGDGARHASHY